MESRRSELEKKRQKLLELRKAKEERRNAPKPSMPAVDAIGILASSTSPLSSSVHNAAKEIDDLVSSLVGTSPATSVVSPSAVATSAASITVEEKRASPSLPVTRPEPKLMASEITLLDLPPKISVQYDKEIQTSEVIVQTSDDLERQQELAREREEAWKKQLERAEKERQRLEEEKLAKEKAKHEEQQSKSKDLSDEEKKRILETSEFQRFFQHSTKIVERSLNENYDFMKDYTVAASEQDGSYDRHKIKQICVFRDESKWTSNRTVTALDWSSKFPELSLAAYNKNPAAIHDPSGLVLVWNLHLLQRPEFVFHAQSEVTASIFSPFHPNLVVGGTYAGQILLWDTRANNSMPVLKSPLTSGGHTHPVYSMNMVGTQNANNLISASTDGMLCTWQLNMLAKPVETQLLSHPNPTRTEEVPITTFDFPYNESTNIWIGTADGNIHHVNRQDHAGTKAGVDGNTTYRGHAGPITGLHFHPLAGPVDFSEMLLTSSVDWTVNLWKIPVLVTDEIAPLLTFHATDDYVFDVKWSRSHPAMFGTVDGSGRFDIWNLNVDTEVPVVSTQVGNAGTTALNKLSWDHTGRKCAVGTNEGEVFVYDMGDLATATLEDSTAFQKVLHSVEKNLEQNAAGTRRGADVSVGH